MTGLRSFLSDLLAPPAMLSAVPAFSRGDDPGATPGQSLENPRTPWDRMFEVERQHAGVPVSEISSLQLAAVWRCVNIIAGTLGRVPFMVYRRDSKTGRTIARDHYLWNLFNVEANPLLTGYRFRRLMQTWALLWGNAYAEIEISGRGQITALWPWRPDRTQVNEQRNSSGHLVGIQYKYTMQNGATIVRSQNEMLHIRGLETDGLKGLGPISANRQALGLAMAAEQYGARYFGQGIHVGGWVSHPAALGKDAKKNISETLNDLYGGLRGSHKIAVLEEGMKYESVGVPPEDMQFLQTRQFQAIDIARLFGVPPHMIAELSRATFSNIEHQGIEFATMCMADWFKNWEQECAIQLLSAREAQTIELDFFEQDLLRGDAKTRYETYMLGRQNTILSPNDCREMEGLNRIDEDWADDYMQPLNMAPAGEGDAVPDDPNAIDPGDGSGSEPKEPPDGTPLPAPAAKPAKKKEKKHGRA